jgi:hypothetical protein
MTSASRYLGTMWKNRGLTSKRIHVLFLCSLATTHPQR